MHECCDALQIAPGRGRYTALGARYGLSSKAARKWLIGDGYPEMAMAIRIADDAKVNLNWLLQGVGQKWVGRLDTKALLLDEAVRSLGPESALDLFHNLRAKLGRATVLTARDSPSRYTSMLDAYEAEISKRKV